MRPGEPAAHLPGVLEPDPNGTTRHIGCVELDQRHALGGEQNRQPAKQGERVATDPEVAVGEQGGRPSAGTRQSVEHRPCQDQRPAVPGELDDVGGDVHTKYRYAAGRQSHSQPARSATDVQGRASASLEQAGIAGVGDGRPGMGRQCAGPAIGVAQQQRCGRVAQAGCVDRRDAGDRPADAHDRSPRPSRCPLTLPQQT